MKPRLQRRVMATLIAHTLLVVLVFGALAMAFAYAVEDGFFTATLRTEADRQRQHRARHGTWAEPAVPYLQLFPEGRGLPQDLGRLIGPVDPAAAETPRGEGAGDNGRHYHWLALDPDGTLLVAEVSGQLVVRPLRQTLLAWLMASGAVLTLLALAVGAWLTRRTSGPLLRLAEAVSRSRPEALPRQLAAGLAHDEVGELARHLDALHGRTQAFIERERAFTADASHELRTPLAVLTVALERLAAKATPPQQPQVRVLQAAVWQLQQTVDLLLALARESPGASAVDRQPDLPGGPVSAPRVPDAAQHPAPRPGAVPLLPVLERTVLAHAPLLEQQGVALELQVPAGLTRPWPPALTQVLVSNLLANALAHGCEPRILIQADAHGLTVANPSDERPLTPGPRRAGATPSQAELHDHPASEAHHLGRGLSIVHRLAQRHGLVLSLSHEAGWTRATLSDAPPAPTCSGSAASSNSGLAPT